MGSVKDFTVIERPETGRTGVGSFIFSDRYSVFDWGEMPDHIEGKGAALCITSAYFFEQLEKEGIKTHYLGVIEDGRAKKLSELKNPQNIMQIRLVRVIRPNLVSLRGERAAKQSSGLDCAAPVHNDYYDYTPIKNERANFLIPLEVIYRNSLPEGSSVFKRLKLGTLKLETLGLKEMPAPGTRLERPLFDVSTKLESTDRYLTWDEAREISGLSNKELDLLKKNVFAVNDLLSAAAKRADLANEDGKVEFGFDEKRELLLLDTVGTLDECRFTYGGVPVSKEILRMHYRGTQWYNEAEEAKKKGVEWKKSVKSRPDNLPPELKRLVSQLYKAGCNEITGREWFKGVPSIGEVLREIMK